ncbi:hypothetical protein EVAR_31551_1 [Eumeta japonica]|uniref:Uncharacterized protein n=1 Tax=Eumeta variegata TaxID=151549 RepID=A0A4C1V8N5_EUMVA|nr:hypothetical protein EVAR_31551_1 [Eumeta japonica]
MVAHDLEQVVSPLNKRLVYAMTFSQKYIGSLVRHRGRDSLAPTVLKHNRNHACVRVSVSKNGRKCTQYPSATIVAVGASMVGNRSTCGERRVRCATLHAAVCDAIGRIHCRRMLYEKLDSNMDANLNPFKILLSGEKSCSNSLLESDAKGHFLLLKHSTPDKTNLLSKAIRDKPLLRMRRL